MSISRRLMQSSSPLLIALVLGLFISMFCVLWFMFTAMESERIASIKRIEEMVHRDVLSSLKASEESWLEIIESNQAAVPSWQFKQIIDHGLIISAIIPSRKGKPGYPSKAFGAISPKVVSPSWKLAQKAEFINKDYKQAKHLYEKSLSEVKSTFQKIVILQAISRVDAATGSWQLAMQSLSKAVKLASLLQPSQNVSEIKATALFRILEIAKNNTDLDAISLLEEKHLLVQMLQDYSEYSVTASQRLSLAMRLNNLFGETLVPAQLIYAERVADRYSEGQSSEGRILQYEEVAIVKLYHKASKISIFIPLDNFEGEINQLSPDLNGVSYAIELYDKSNTPSSLSQASHIPLTGIYSGLSLEITNQEHNSEAINNTKIALYVLTAGVFIALLLSLYLFIALQVRRHERNQKLRTDILATVSHELKTPLTSTRLLIDNLKDSQLNLPKEVREYIDIISNENYRLSGLVDNFMIFSRMERGKHVFSLEKISVDQLVCESAAVVSSKYPKGRLDIDVESYAVPIVVQGDEALLKTAIINLLDNAFKYSPDDQYAQIRCWLDNDGVCISVMDKGIGLSAEQQKLVFDRFYRVNYQAEGCGLGLNITQYIVNQHGGSISVSSQLGNGTTFTIWLPNFYK